MTNPGLSGGRAMLELAERVEKATGPDRALDADIAAALHVKQLTYQSPEWIKVPEFTASLDAAMSLVLEGWRLIRIEHIRSDEAPQVVLIEPHGPGYIKTQRGTAATTWQLALCAAALRARAADAPSVKL